MSWEESHQDQIIPRCYEFKGLGDFFLRKNFHDPGHAVKKHRSEIFLDKHIWYKITHSHVCRRCLGQPRLSITHDYPLQDFCRRATAMNALRLVRFSVLHQGKCVLAQEYKRWMQQQHLFKTNHLVVRSQFSKAQVGLGVFPGCGEALEMIATLRNMVTWACMCSKREWITAKRTLGQVSVCKKETFPLRWSYCTTLIVKEPSRGCNQAQEEASSASAILPASPDKGMSWGQNGTEPECPECSC